MQNVTQNVSQTKFKASNYKSPRSKHRRKSVEFELGKELLDTTLKPQHSKKIKLDFPKFQLFALQKKMKRQALQTRIFANHISDKTFTQNIK